jgi:hypothetical protein
MMPIYEVTMTLTAYVRVDGGTEDEVANLARKAVANGPCLSVKMGEVQSRDLFCGDYCVKGMSAAVESVKPWIGNREVMGAAKAEAGEEET